MLDGRAVFWQWVSAVILPRRRERTEDRKGVWKPNASFWRMTLVGSPVKNKGGAQIDNRGRCDNARFLDTRLLDACSAYMYTPFFEVMLRVRVEVPLPEPGWPFVYKPVGVCKKESVFWIEFWKVQRIRAQI
ncbi:uncharacterized protein LACBIDRAFT_321781 [Laccaria bicolor S238N-H82]|uniref:Predicted protein n=1 Tax=Laccaria bicolor (strain S238N-H82 / ATCC MYA-4686) TaxID=486041 RepID=B0CU51_LACBS|nr:uncharacterized protein LACBIDRAFT_321781 [Laccaria bicolor S238N-H82]EDR14608.1 predicted protein [Laccaria bicolor S238N-H82]|eukprot:XP_001875167.1 predicted protein [Laccaria bicolor S238N-H82]